MKKADGERDEKNKEKIDQSYGLWKNPRWTPFSTMFIAHELESQSLTVECLAAHRKVILGTTYWVQTVILGTYEAYNESNYLIRAEVTLPDEKSSNINDECFDNEDGSKLESSEHIRKVEIVQKIKHEGRVNRARSMGQNQFFIATKTVKPEVYVYDYRKHSNEHPPDDGSFNPDLRLRGHDMGGYGLSWSKLKEGHLLSGSNQICLWDINATPNNKAIDAMTVIRGYYVKDVAWHPNQADVFGSVGNDKCLRIWDCRVPSISNPSQSVVAHQSKVRSRDFDALYVDCGEVTCLDFNPINQWLVVTGSSDKTVKLFDTRRIDTVIHTFDDHYDAVSQVEWNPKDEEVFASSAEDGKLLVWDLGRIGEGHSPQRASETPPELLFRRKVCEVNDFTWNFLKDWCFASVGWDYRLHIWQMVDFTQFGHELEQRITSHLLKTRSQDMSEYTHN